MTLNSNQARVVAIRLRMLEQDVAEIERLMTVHEAGRLYRRDRPAFRHDQRTTIASLIEGVRGTIAAIAERFDLPPEHQDSRQRIGAILAMNWESIGEIDTNHLTGYGEVDSSLSDDLDPAIHRLVALILELQEAAGRTPVGGSTRSGDVMNRIGG